MAEYEKQHIVPQAYLNRFGTKTRRKYQIGVMQRDNTGSFRYFFNSVENVGYIKNYYDVNCRPDKKYWEHYYADNIEPLYGDRLTSIISSITLANIENFFLSPDDKRDVSIMMCAQMLRHPPMIDRWARKAKGILPLIKKEMLDTKGSMMSLQAKRKLHSIQLPYDQYKDVVLGVATDNDRLNFYADKLSERVWLIFYNSTSVPFITSDNPIIIYNVADNRIVYENQGIARPDTALYFPLSSKIMVQLLPKEFFFGDDQPLNSKMHILEERDLKYVMDCNLNQIDHCYREAFVPVSLMAQIMTDESNS